MPLISIIVPIYNVEKYLDECIQSIISQTFTDVEIILVDDGSTDSSQKICEQYTGSSCRIRLYNKPNGGLSSARNYGLDRANGKYVIFIDSDDYWTNTQTLEHLISIAETTNADVVRGEHKEIDEVGKDLYLPAIPSKLHLLENKPTNNAIFLESILSRGHFSVLFLFRKTAIGNLRFNIEQKFQEDIDFNIRFFSIPRICVYTSFRFYAYRKRANSIITTPNINNLKYSFLLSSTWYDYAQRIIDGKLKKQYLYNSTMMYYWTLETISLDVYYNQRGTIIKDLSLNKIQQQIKNWAKKDGRSLPFLVRIHPHIGVLIFRYFNILKKFVQYYGSKCKTLFINSHL